MSRLWRGAAWREREARLAAREAAVPVAIEYSGGDSSTEMPAPRDGVPRALAAAAGWSWRILVIALAVTMLGKLALTLELVVLPLLTSLLITALLYPLHRRLREALPASLAAVSTVLVAIAVLGGITVYVVNRAIAEYPDLVQQLGTLVDNTQHYLKTGPLKLNPQSVDNAGSELLDYLQRSQGRIAEGAVTAGRTIVDVLTGLVLTLFLTIFMLYDGARIWGWITQLFPRRNRPKLDRVGSRMWQTLTGYVTGTFMVALFHGVVMGTTLVVLGVPLVAPLALMVFVGSFIPLLGAVLFGGLAVLVSLVTNGLTTAVIVLVVLVVANQVESHVLQPFIIGRHVNLHPMAIAITLTAGAVVAGLPGAIFSVPLVASLNAAGKALTGRDAVPMEDSPPPPPEPGDADPDGLGERPAGDGPHGASAAGSAPEPEPPPRVTSLTED